MKVFDEPIHNPDNPLRASVCLDPAGKRINTKDNTPAVVHISMVPGNTVEIQIAAKGGGSENKTKMVMLNPSDDIAEWVEKNLANDGSGLVSTGHVRYRYWRHCGKSGSIG